MSAIRKGIGGRGFTSRGHELGLCLVQLCEARKRYIVLLPSVLKDKRSCFSQGEGVHLPYDKHVYSLEVGYNVETIYMALTVTRYRKTA